MRLRNVFAPLALGLLGVVAGTVACTNDGSGGGSIVIGRNVTNEMDINADEGWKSCQAPAATIDDLKVSGPYSHENLEIYLVHGKDQVKPKREILTLEEALEKGKAVVHETSNVNQLAVENVCSDADIYVQSGDIVQGGKQDRVLAVDLMLSPKSGRVPIASYCVEQGRWGARGLTEISTGLNQQFGVRSFGISSNSLSSLELKKAVKVSMAQDMVWANVAAQQAQLADNCAGEVRSRVSGSSLQLTLETKAVRDSAEKYTKTLAEVIEGKDDVLGFAAVVNGKIASADVYGSNKLFHKLWDKLLAASAVEAVAVQKDGKKSAPIGTEKVAAFLADMDQAKAKSKNVTSRVQLVQCEGRSNHFFETRDRANGTAWLHRNYLPK